MDKFIKDIIGSFKKSEKIGSCKSDLPIWYNEQGDCIQFIADQVAEIADRIDDYLTIYRSAEDDKPIGFQLKDVKALIRKFGYKGIQVEALVSQKNLVSVTALLLSAFCDMGPSISRREGYARAIQTLPREADRIPIPV